MGNPRRFFDPKVLSRITRLDFKARQVVEGYISGLHRSPFHGFSVEFADHREYVPGDDIKRIDWKVYAKQDRFYIKEFEEETNLKCHILLDCSESMRYRSGETSKFEHGCRIAASLSYLLINQQDAVGLVLFDSEIRRFIPASSNPAHLAALAEEMDRTDPAKKTEVSTLFNTLAEKFQRRGMIVLISDCFVKVLDLLKGLQHFRHKRHEVILFHVLDPYELSFPFQGNVLFKGLESWPELLTEPQRLRRSYLEALERYLQELREGCATHRIEYVKMSTADPLEVALSAFLASRTKGGSLVGKY